MEDEEIQYLGTTRTNLKDAGNSKGDEEAIGRTPSMRLINATGADDEQSITGLILFTENKPITPDTRTRVFFKSVGSISIGRVTAADNVDEDADEKAVCGVVRAGFICPVISREHAKIEFLENGKVYLTDIGSHHGTYIRGKTQAISVSIPRIETLKPQLLHDGDGVTFGKAVYKDEKWYPPVTLTVKLIYGSDPKPTKVPPSIESPLDSRNNVQESSGTDGNHAKSTTPNRYGYYSPSSSPSSSSGSESSSGISESESGSDSENDSIQEVTPPTSISSSSGLRAMKNFALRATCDGLGLPLPSLRRLGLLLSQSPTSQPQPESQASSDGDMYASPPSFPENQLGLPYDDEIYGGHHSDAECGANSRSSSPMQISEGSDSPRPSRTSTPDIIGAWPQSPEHPASNTNSVEEQRASNTVRLNPTWPFPDDAGVHHGFNPPFSCGTSMHLPFPWRAPDAVSFMQDVSRSMFSRVPFTEGNNLVASQPLPTNPWAVPQPTMMPAPFRPRPQIHNGAPENCAPDLQPPAEQVRPSTSGEVSSIQQIAPVPTPQSLFSAPLVVADQGTDNDDIQNVPLLRPPVVQPDSLHQIGNVGDTSLSAPQVSLSNPPTMWTRPRVTIRDEIVAVKLQLHELTESIQALNERCATLCDVRSGPIVDDAVNDAVQQATVDPVVQHLRDMLVDKQRELESVRAACEQALQRASDVAKADEVNPDEGAVQPPTAAQPLQCECSGSPNVRKRKRSVEDDDEMQDEERVGHFRPKRGRLTRTLTSAASTAGTMTVGAIAAWTALAFL
ncbi:hypothetical protein BD410DRAFT_787284 [Rickenella mellea]|uniref:FHA domain-containing protein n=1 Tax=Rickenella mellea TaxID=50990 RepID=A0A4Y7Q803_9AGAM|nr:hypothetical protein BD410DRAFT_787284 [Rickenella mellea]